jgi:hypothetical protein
MAKKIITNDLTNSKVRKELYDFNQAIKSVYNGYRIMDNIATPMSMAAIKSRPLFDKSFFVHKPYEEPFTFFDKSIVYPEELNKALKDKCTEYDFDDMYHHLIGKDKKGDTLDYIVSIPMTDFQIEDSANYGGLNTFRELYHSDKCIAEYIISGKDSEELLDYEVIDRVIGQYKGEDIRLIASKELFPMIKRVDEIVIFVYRNKSLPKGVYEIIVKSTAEAWTFYSIHHILC